MQNKKTFDPSHWKNEGLNNNNTVQNSTSANNLETSDIEKVVAEIEAKQIDIAPDYKDWLACGFALADMLNEAGRDYFHRISRFYNAYSAVECDKQFDNCLKSKGYGVTKRTFFDLARRAGINISPARPVESTNIPNDDFIETPCFPEEIFSQLPGLLSDACKVFTTARERDIILLGSIVTISSCLPNVYGIYYNDKVYPNLYLFVTAQASAGKGSLKHCKRLVHQIHMQLREQSTIEKGEYQIELNQYLQQIKKDPTLVKPTEPKEKMLFLPANNSSTGIFQLLDDSDGKGLIFETEGDTLALIFKTDYGNYSDGFRKAFHHENISYYRRTNREYVDIQTPRLSAVLTGTPRQIVNLIPDAEDGLFSRFMYYRFSLTNIWSDVFQKQTNNGFEDYFNSLGRRYFELYRHLISIQEREFHFTQAQQVQFNQKFEAWQTEFINLLGPESVANVRRLGLICYRTAMIMTVLRIIDTGEMPDTFYCSDVDFNTVMIIGNVLLEHAKTVYLQLATTSKKMKQETMKDRFYNLLPDEFLRKEAIEIAAKLNIKPRTADKYLNELTPSNLLKDPVYGKYKKQNMQSVQSVQNVQKN
jgi:hypothetical protein